MKYLIMLFACILTISSCKRKCGTCYGITTMTASPPKIGYPVADTSLFHLCGGEYEDTEKSTPTSDTRIVSGYTITTTQGYSCVHD